MLVFRKVRHDAVGGLVDRREVRFALLGAEMRRDHLGAAVVGEIDHVRAFLQAKADEGLHHRHGAARAFFQGLVAPLGHADVLDQDIGAREHALEALQRRVVRAGALVDADRHAGEIARLLDRRIEAEDRLRGDRRPQGEYLRAAATLLAAIDARPFAQVVDVGLAAFEERFLQALEWIGVGRAALRVLRLEAHLDARVGEEALVARDIDRQVEHRVVRRDIDDGCAHGATVKRGGAP